MSKKMKVMVVEDNNVLADALMIVLKDKGYELSLATDGEEAEKKILQELPDLVLLDLLLPKKSGLEVLRAMRKNPQTKNISVVILTNFEQDTSVSDAKKLKVKDYIVKSNMSISDFPRMVEKYLQS